MKLLTNIKVGHKQKSFRKNIHKITKINRYKLNVKQTYEIIDHYEGRSQIFFLSKLYPMESKNYLLNPKIR